jgi:hypothetical protein
MYHAAVLTSKDKVNLLDFIENENGMIPKKMTGRFSLLQFVIRDMRNYAHLKYFAIDRAAVIEDDGGFIDAVHSFQIMYSVRIIVICEDCLEIGPFLRQLIMSGVTDIVTATEIKEIQADLLECLSRKECDGSRKEGRGIRPPPLPSKGYRYRNGIPLLVKIFGLLLRVASGVWV